MGPGVAPYKTVITDGHKYLTSLTIMAFDAYWDQYDPKVDFQNCLSYGVPKEKLVWGLMPGQHDAPKEFTNLTAAKDIAEYVKDQQFGGVMVWDMNRDTDHRTSRQGDLFQTGKPDGTFVNLMANILHAPDPTVSTVSKVKKEIPFVSAYWENWNMQAPTDYGASLTGFEIGKIGSGKGVNVVNICFGDYSFGQDE